jgi:hypothetical protein
MIKAGLCCFHRTATPQISIDGRFQMSLSRKFFSLALAAAFFLPAALAVMSQAAQIVV